ncbi:DUF2726 domain-containing protein [Novosphingobium sp. 9U]|uniref:DUF2726 domain-containing protein n=1 Tax=Novosphingobium sp. 9U TaxID=2653158 RepID=UPI0012EF10F7|nr:DUF2726 domain-containing protein [Novosphingobium sp. 9U]VWX51096.1 conserved hypothetical protein [Novosphingobium sp. 9U]
MTSNLLQLVLPVLALFGVVLLLKGLLGSFTGPTVSVRPMPLMTPAERKTIGYIEQILPWARIHAQVSMGAILAPRKGLNRSQAATVRNRFSSKRIDYVVEHRRSGRIVMLIELDDRTHRPDQDARRDKMTASAGFATLRLPAEEHPTLHSVKYHINRAFAQRPDLMPSGVAHVA